MSQNMVSLTISDEQATSAMAGASQVGAALPGLVSLEPDDRKGLVYMGSKSEVFCRQTIRLLEQNPQIIPPSMDLDGAVADLAALDRLRPIHDQLRPLLSLMDATITVPSNERID